GFDSAMLEVFVNSFLAYQTSFASLADAQAFHRQSRRHRTCISRPRNCRVGFRFDRKPTLQWLPVRLCAWDGPAFGSPRPRRGCRTSGPAVGERWPSRLVATAAEKPLSFLTAQSVHVVCGSQRLPRNRDL